MINPFFVGGAVSESQFFGRDSEIELLRERIGSASRDQLSESYVAIYGHRGFGKSSILKQLDHLESEEGEAFCVTATGTNKSEFKELLAEIVNKNEQEVQKARCGEAWGIRERN